MKVNRKTHCPICGRQLSDAEWLFVTNDSIGSSVVFHMIPEGFDSQRFHEDNKNDYVDDLTPYFPEGYVRNVLPYDVKDDSKYRDFCGSAGFKIGAQ